MPLSIGETDLQGSTGAPAMDGTNANDTLSVNEDVHQQANAQIDKLIPHDIAWRCSVQILQKRGDNLHGHGTGMLFRIADDSFLVTASHVYQDATEQPLRIAGPNRKIVPLAGTWFLGQEPLDVAVLKLDSFVLEHLETDSFLRLNHVSFEEDFSKSMFTIFGFPQIMSTDEKGVLRRTRFHFMTYGFTGNTTTLEDYQHDHHFLLRAALSEATTIKGRPLEFNYRGGVSAPFPRELRGMSGCSVWKIADANSPTRFRNSEHARIVGVQTGVYHKEECIKATKWAAVIGVIVQAIPELRGPVELWRGN
jgi:hypothetical protein